MKKIKRRHNKLNFFLEMNLCKWLKFKIHSLHLRASWLLWNMKVREIIDSYFNTQNHFSYQWMIKQGNNINVKIIPFEMIDTCIFQSQYWLKKYMWKIFFSKFSSSHSYLAHELSLILADSKFAWFCHFFKSRKV